MNYGLAYRQAHEMQQVLYKLALDPSTPGPSKALCARAWDVLEERKRIIRGKPLPGTYRPELPKPKAKHYPSLLAVPYEG